MNLCVDEPRSIVYLAHTFTMGDRIESSIDEYKRNIDNASKTLQIASINDVKKIIYVSSGGTVYGEALCLPIDEEHPTNPKSTYGRSKLFVEEYLKNECERLGIILIILRPGNIFGPGHTRKNQGIINVAIEKLLADDVIEIYGDGESVRDYLYVDDLVSALVKAIFSPHQGSGVFNVASEIGVSIRDVVGAVSGVLGVNTPKVLYRDSRKIDIRNNVLSAKRFRALFDWQTNFDLITGIRRTVDSRMQTEAVLSSRLDGEFSGP
jgi:UDP-glucose 4-epimerase